MLEELLTTAEKKEKEKTLFPLWLVNYAGAKLKKEKYISFEDFMSELDGKKSEKQTPTNAEKSPDDIIKEFAPIVAADRLRRVKNGEHI